MASKHEHNPGYLIALGLVMLMVIPSYIIAVRSESEAPARGVWLDIAVDGIDVQRPSQSNNIYPGQKITVWVKLIHDNRPFESDTLITPENQFTVVLVVDDTYNNVTTQYKTVSTMPLNHTGADPPHGGQNSPYIVYFIWTVPMRKPVGVSSWNDFSFMMHATITVDDDDKSDNFRSGSGVRISEPEFAPMVIEEGEKDGKGPIHDVIVGNPYFIPFLLMNDGPALDNIGIEILSVPDGWNTDPFSPRVVYPNDAENLELPIQIPNNPFFALNTEKGKEKIYSIEVRAYSAFYPDGPYLSNERHTFRFKVAFKPGAEMWPAKPYVYLEPGLDPNTNKVDFYIKNTGNGESTYTLSTNLQDIDKKRGWDVTFKSGDAQQEAIEPNKVYMFSLKVRVPLNAMYLTNINIVVRATLTASAVTYEAFSQNLIVYADKHFAADIQNFEKASFKVEPGRENIIKFNFTNMGNTKDDTLFLNVTHKPYDWTVIIDQSQLRGKGIGPYTTVTLTMVCIIPETSSATLSTFRPMVKVEARGGSPPKKLDTEEFYFEVPLKYKLELSSPQPEKEGFLGGKLVFDVNVRNAGNNADGDTFNLSVDHPWAELEQDQIEIGSNEIVTLKLYVDIPQNAAADTNPDTPFPYDPVKNWYDGYKISVKGYSTNETKNGGKKGSTMTKVDLVLHVQPFYNFEMEIDPLEKPLQFSMDHDQSRTVRVKVTNLGNIALTVKLGFVDNPHSWLRLQNTYIDVPYGRSSYATLFIDLSADTVSEIGDITVHLRGSARTGFSGEIEYRIPITVNFYRLMFDFTERMMNNEPFTGVLNGERDLSYSFQVNISNVGSKDLHPFQFEPLYVVLYDGSFEIDRANITYLQVGQYKVIRFRWVASTPGPHQISIVLEGDLPISEKGEVKESWIMNIRKEPIRVEPDNSLELYEILIPLALLIIFATAMFVFISRYNQIFISPIDTGYDEKGEYRPWAVKDQFKEETKQLEPKEAPPQLPPPSKPGLPPAPSEAKLAPAAAAPVPVQTPRPVVAAPVSFPQARPVPSGPMAPVQARPGPVQPMAARPVATPVSMPPLRPVQPPVQK